MQEGVMEKLTTLMEDFSTSEETKERIIWTVCNLCRGKVYEYCNLFLEFIPHLIKFFNASVGQEEISKSLFIIYKLSSSTSICLDKFINSNVYNRIVSVMNEYDLSIKYYCVRIIANMASGNDVQTQILIQNGVVELYKGLLEETDIKVVKEALWGISNICGGTVSQIAKVFSNNILDKILDIVDYLIPLATQDKAYYEVKYFLITHFLRLLEKQLFALSTLSQVL
jgi:hypothetical protein